MVNTLKDKIKEFAQISECLDAIAFVTENTDVLSVQAIEILDEELVKRGKEDPLRDVFEHQKRLIEALRNLVEKLKPKILKDLHSPSVSA